MAAPGDLAYRKLYPALFHRERSNQFSEPTRIIGASRRHLDRDAFRASVKDALMKFHVIDDEAGAATERFLSRLDFVAVDAMSDGGWADLKALLGADERIRAYYLATGPDLFGPLAKRLGAEGLVTSRSRIIVEKPIGRDGASAAAINDVIGSVFLERNIFRIDHYLGKESVQNLMALRFANILLGAAVEQRSHRSCADHRRRDARRRGTRRLLRRSRRHARHGPEPYDAARLPRCDGAAEFARRGLAAG